MELVILLAGGAAVMMASKWAAHAHEGKQNPYSGWLQDRTSTPLGINDHQHPETRHLGPSTKVEHLVDPAHYRRRKLKHRRFRADRMDTYRTHSNLHHPTQRRVMIGVPHEEFSYSRNGVRGEAGVVQGDAGRSFRYGGYWRK
jgi:hypothetical protein